MSEKVIVEFRGARDLVYAEVLEDTVENFETGDVKPLAGLQEVSRATETSSETKYYDNVAAIVIKSKGSDEVTLVTSVLDLETQADILGQYRDPDTGALVEGDCETKYLAIGYIEKLTDGTERYVWRYKGTFSIPDESSSTEDDGTESKNQELKYTGVNTIHKFEKTGKTASALIVDERDGKADLTNFFKQVTTIDTLQTKTIALKDKVPVAIPKQADQTAKATK